MKALKYWLGIISIALTMVTFNAYSVTLSLLPASQTAMPSDTVSVDLVIDGLGNYGPDSLGAFDIDMEFDPAALSFDNYSLGLFLGDSAFGEAFDFSFGDMGFGIVNISVVSLLDPDSTNCTFCIPPYLDDIQPDSFLLATLEFMIDVLPIGSSTTVEIDNVWTLSDGFGLPLILDGTATAEIGNPDSGSIPEPSTLILMGFGLAAFGYRRRHNMRDA